MSHDMDTSKVSGTRRVQHTYAKHRNVARRKCPELARNHAPASFFRAARFLALFSAADSYPTIVFHRLAASSRAASSAARRATYLVHTCRSQRLAPTFARNQEKKSARAGGGGGRGHMLQRQWRAFHCRLKVWGPPGSRVWVCTTHDLRLGGRQRAVKRVDHHTTAVPRGGASHSEGDSHLVWVGASPSRSENGVRELVCVCVCACARARVCVCGYGH